MLVTSLSGRLLKILLFLAYISETMQQIKKPFSEILSVRMKGRHTDSKNVGD